MTGYSFTTPVREGGKRVAPAVAGVRAAPRANGPEGPPRAVPGQWDKVSWREQEDQVRRLRQLIFKAAREQDWPRVRNLQKLMLRSRANTLVSVRQVTQRSQAGMCPLCGDHLLPAGQPPQSPARWEQWWLRVTRKAIAASYLVCHGIHVSCHRRKPEPQLPPETPLRLA